MEYCEQHGVDNAEAERDDLVAENVGPAVQSGILGNDHLEEGAACDQNDRNEDGQEGCEGRRDVVAGDQDVLDVVGGGLLDLSDYLRNRLDKFLVGPLAQDQPGQYERDQRDQDAPADDQTEVSAEQDGYSQDTGRRRNHRMGQVQTGLGERRHLAHRDMLALGQDVCDVGGQNGGDIAEYRDRYDVGGQRRSKLKVFAAEQLDEEVRDGLCSAGVLNAHCEDRAEHDRDTHTAECAAEAAGDRRQNIRKSEALRFEASQNKTHEQRRDEQRKGRMQFDFHDQYHQYRDGNDQQNQKSSCRHSFYSLS